MTDLKVFDAPAGSGKSTEIKARVREWAAINPLGRLLCVTFTNRAADELKNGISAKNVDVSTIHAFLSDFMKPVFANPKAVALFLELNKTAIEARLANVEGKPSIEKSNERYAQKLGEPLTFEVIASSIKRLYYNETQFDSLLSGGLSHNSLLAFANQCVARFPGVARRLNAKYRQIIIDEYQDSNVSTLEFFLAAVDGSETALHLYGDPMQQIYQITSERMRELLSKFGTDDRTVVNYRSSRAIVAALNRIYNDQAVVQKANTEAISEKPRVHLTADPSGQRLALEIEDTLVLSVKNSSILENIGANELFLGLQRVSAHAYGSRYPALDVIRSPRWNETNNALIQLLYGLLFLEDRYLDGEIGVVIQLLRQNPQVFGISPVSGHKDKERLEQELKVLFKYLHTDDLTIQELLLHLASCDYLPMPIYESYTEDEEYAQLLGVPFVQARRMFGFNQRPGWSTQHGVKGESHDRVLFLAEDAPHPVNVRMHTLLNLWPVNSFNLRQLEDFYVQVEALFVKAREDAHGYYSKPSKTAYDDHADTITSAAREVVDRLGGNPLFDALYAEVFETYLSKLHTSSAKPLFSTAAIEGLLTAYRLFYVGCSRSRVQLDVIVNKGKIADTASFSAKFEELGFEVVTHS